MTSVMPITDPGPIPGVLIQEHEPAQVDMLKRAVCVNVELHGLGSTRKVPTGSVEVDADKDLVHVSKTILDSPELKAIRKFDGETRQWLYTQCIQSGYRWGLYLVPIKCVERVEKKLQERAAARKEMVEKWTAKDESGLSPYDRQVSETQERLGVLGNSADYPSAERIRAMHTFTWQYMSFGVPAALKAIRVDLFEQEQEKAKKKWAEATAEVQATMRGAMADLVDHMVEKLSGNRTKKCPDCEKHALNKPIGDDTPCPTCCGKGEIEEAGKPKIFRDSLVGNVKEFLASFSDRNITEDAELEKLVNEAKSLVAGVDPKTLRQSEAVRSYVQGGFAAIKAQLDGMLINRPIRKISFEEE